MPTLSTDERLEAFRAALVPWYLENARELPWRRDSTPYRVWVSEIMLQQTRVEAVIPYFERFLKRFPDLEALAAAGEEQVLEAWSGLGYYRRARMLQAGARMVRDRFAGEFPTDEKAALSIPGVGRYTAGAIRSLALGVRAPILDGNVTRVLTRMFAIRGDVSRANVSRRLWDLAERVVREGEPATVNQAQMELGALVCTAAEAKCSRCPVAGVCGAREEGIVDELPVKPRPRPAVELDLTVLLVRDGGNVLLRRRRSNELLPGMWDLPGAFTGSRGDRSSGFREAAALLPFRVRALARLGRVRHAVTYRRITLDVREAALVERLEGRSEGADDAELIWCAPEAALERALSSPARRILRRWGSPGARLLDTGERSRVS